MFALFHTRRKLPKEEAEPRPGPAQRNLSEQCGIETWSPIIDWTSLESQQAALDRRLATYDGAKRPATTEGIVPRRPGISSRDLSVTNNKPVGRQRPEGKQPVARPSTARADVDLGVIAQPCDTYQRKTTRTSGDPTVPPTAPPRTPSARGAPGRDKYDRVTKEEARYVNKPDAGAPGLTRRPAMWNPKTSGTSAPTPSTPGPSSPADSAYPAPVPRWMDPHKIEAELTTRAVKQMARSASARDAPNITANTKPTRLPQTSSREGPVFGGEHPAVAFARQAAKQDYECRKACEPGLVDPDTVPIDTTWQERTYSGRAVGAAWVKLEKERGPRDPTHTSAVPSPLSIQKGAADTKIEVGGGPRVPEDPFPRAYMPPMPQMSYCYAACEYMRGMHMRSLDRDCICTGGYTSVSARRDGGKTQRPSASGQVMMDSDAGKRREPRIKFSIAPHPRYNATGNSQDGGGDDDDNNDRYVSSRGAPAPVKPYQGQPAVSTVPGSFMEDGPDYFAVPIEKARKPTVDEKACWEGHGSDSDSSDSEILAPARPRRLQLAERPSNRVKSGDSSASWKSPASADSSSSSKSWKKIKAKLGVAEQTSFASFVCKDAAQIENRSKE